MSPEYEFSILPPNKRQEFIKSWEKAFKRQLEPCVYDWIFDSTNLIYVAMYAHEIAAGYCLYPVDGIVSGEATKALLCNNVFVDPKHQGKNLFVRLGKYALQSAGALGYRFAYGIPNAMALPGHLRVGWSLQPTIGFLEKARGDIRIAKTSEWCYGILTDKQLRAIEDCSVRASVGRGFSILKTSEFVRWRYLSKPSVKYWFGLAWCDGILSAYCVVKFYAEKNCVHFVDIDGTDSDAVTSLIRSVDSINSSFKFSNVWDSTAHANCFLDCGYATSSHKDSLIFIDPLYLKKITVEGRVNLVLGDNDVY